MYIELEVRRPGQDNWVKQAIDECLIEVVRPWFCCDGHGCLIYDQDDVILWQCKMPYRQLLDKLNGLEDEKQDLLSPEYFMDVGKGGQVSEWHPKGTHAPCGTIIRKPVFSVVARFTSDGCIYADSVRVVK